MLWCPSCPPPKPASELPSTPPALMGFSRGSSMLTSFVFLLAYDLVAREFGWMFSWHFVGLFWPSPFIEAAFAMSDVLTSIPMNILFFMGLHFILYRQKILGYLTRRNILLCSAISIAGAIASSLLQALLRFLIFPDVVPSFSLTGSEVAADIGVRYIGNLPGIVALVLIYRYTVGGLTVWKLFFSRTGAGALAVAALFLAVQAIYRVFFFVPPIPVYFPQSPFAIPIVFPQMPVVRDYTEWLFRLHLLWVGLLRLCKPTEPPENSTEPKTTTDTGPEDITPRHAAKGVRFLFLGGLIKMAVSVQAISSISGAGGLGFPSFTTSSIMINLFTIVGSSVLIYSLFLLREVNRYFKRALVFQAVALIVFLAFIWQSHAAHILHLDRIIQDSITIIGFVILFNICWGLAMVAQERNLPNLEIWHKWRFYLGLLLLPIVLVFGLAIRFVLLEVNVFMPETTLPALIPMLLLSVLGLYLERHTYHQLESKTPMDLKDTFLSRLKAKPQVP